MKVLRKGITSKRVMCNRCKAVLEVDRSDIVRWDDSDGYGTSIRSTTQGVVCPECGAHIEVWDLTPIQHG